MVELVFAAGPGRVVRLVDDDGLAQAVWLLVDEADPHRSTELPVRLAYELVDEDDRRQLVWSALCCAVATNGQSPAGLSLEDVEVVVEPPERATFRWWLREGLQAAALDAR